MQIDLDSLSLQELKLLQSQVAERISNYEERMREKALSVLEEKARELGYSLSELVGRAAAKKRRRGVARYANPDDPSQTWTGRGRKPRWVLAALAAGRSLDDLRI